MPRIIPILKIDKNMKTYVIGALLAAAAALAGCGHGDDRAASHAGDGAHAEALHLTAYTDDYEVYAEIAPLVAGARADVTIHVTTLNDFKPLAGGQVGAALTCGGRRLPAQPARPSRPGVYTLALTPPAAGSGLIAVEIRTERGRAVATLPAVTVHKERDEAARAAEALEPHAANAVAFGKETSWSVDFATEACREEPFGAVVRAMARVQPAQGDERMVCARTAGIVTAVGGVLAEGARVAAGQSLFRIDTEGMAGGNLAVRLREAEAEARAARGELERKQALARDRIVSESELERARAACEAAEAACGSLRRNFGGGRQAVASPVAGFVERVLVRSGEYVAEGQPVVCVAQNRSLQLRAEIAPKYYGLLCGGADAAVRANDGGGARGERWVRARMVSFGRAVGADSPLLPVTLCADSAAGLLPGTLVETYIRAHGGAARLTVPRTALVEEMDNYFVYVQLTPELFEKREVRIGATDGRRTEIKSGLAQGERVVSRGAVLLKLAQGAGALDAHAGHAH